MHRRKGRNAGAQRQEPLGVHVPHLDLDLSDKSASQARGLERQRQIVKAVSVKDTVVKNRACRKGKDRQDISENQKHNDIKFHIVAFAALVAVENRKDYRK